MTKVTVKKSEDMRQVGKNIHNSYQRKELAFIICKELFEINEKKDYPIVKQANNIILFY